jgi:hypothetical protein
LWLWVKGLLPPPQAKQSFSLYAVYVIGLVMMLALSAAYNICLTRQVGSAPLFRPLRYAVTKAKKLGCFTCALRGSPAEL